MIRAISATFCLDVAFHQVGTDQYCFASGEGKNNYILQQCANACKRRRGKGCQFFNHNASTGKCNMFSIGTDCSSRLDKPGNNIYKLGAGIRLKETFMFRSLVSYAPVKLFCPHPPPPGAVPGSEKICV